MFLHYMNDLQYLDIPGPSCELLSLNLTHQEMEASSNLSTINQDEESYST